LNTETHRGYWWLAYTWGNLIPLCTRCNTYQKKCVFPVARQHHFTEIYDLAALDQSEEPLLINPLYDDFEDHFDVNVVTAQLLPKTIRGETTIRIMGLNNSTSDDDILGARRLAAQQALNAFREFQDAARNDCAPPAMAMQIRDSIEVGSAPFAYTLRAVWNAAHERTADRLKAIT
jgi:hypothetical protein